MRNKNALCWASAFGLKTMVDFLLRVNIDIDCQNTQGLTPLMSACCHGQTEVTELLLSRGADVNKTVIKTNVISNKTELWSPMALAYNNCNTAIVEMLTERGADINK